MAVHLASFGPSSGTLKSQYQMVKGLGIKKWTESKSERYNDIKVNGPRRLKLKLSGYFSQSFQVILFPVAVSVVYAKFSKLLEIISEDYFRIVQTCIVT